MVTHLLHIVTEHKIEAIIHLPAEVHSLETIGCAQTLVGTLEEFRLSMSIEGRKAFVTCSNKCLRCILPARGSGAVEVVDILLGMCGRIHPVRVDIDKSREGSVDVDVPSVCVPWQRMHHCRHGYEGHEKLRQDNKC